MNEAFEQWRQDQDKYNMPTHEETFRAGMLAAAEIAKKFEPDERDGVYFPSDAIREAAKK